MRRLYLTIFLVSCSVLMLEVALTRIFSIYLWYHFAFMVISIAMLGIGCAGTLLAVFSRRKQSSEINMSGSWSGTSTLYYRMFSESGIALYAALAGISILACYVISNYIPFDPVKFSWENKQFFYLALYCFILSIPFLFSGLLIATAFFIYSEKSMFIYGADLIGAGIGSLAVLAILNVAGPEYAVLTASTLCLTAAVVVGDKKIRILTSILLALNFSAYVSHPDFMNVRISPYKSLSLSLQYPGAEHLKTYQSSYSRIDTFRSPAVRFAPGLSLKYLDPLPEQTGFSIDGAGIHVITEAKDKDRLTFLEFLPSSLAYDLRRKGNVIIIDPKGGLQVLMARHYESLLIHKVESNPLTIEIIREDFNEFSGNIYDVTTHTGYGRNYLQSSPLRGKNLPFYSLQKRASRELSHGIYDVIDVTMTDTSVTGVFGIAEDYRYTVEAFKKYLGALKKDGIMSISLYLIPPPRTEFRMLATIISAFEGLGIKDAASRVAAVRSWDSITILVRNTPFVMDEIERIKAFCEERRFDLVYYPGIKEGESNKYIKMPLDEYFIGFNKILNNKMRAPFLDHYLFDIKPVHDDNPFFHYYLNIENVKAIYAKMGQKWLYFLEEGYFLPIVFIIILFLSVLLIIFPVYINAKRKRRFQRFRHLEHVKPFSSFFIFIYFAMLGLGFMFVEVSIIQKSILLLENPSYSVAVILTAILISSGIGSTISSHFSESHASFSLLILSLLVLLYSLIHPVFLSMLSPHTLKFRIIVIAFSVIPLGLFMGIPFPLGIKLLGHMNEALIPWAWAINSCMSVLAPIMTIMLALIFGFKAVFWIGALAYLLAFFSLSRKMHLK